MPDDHAMIEWNRPDQYSHGDSQHYESVKRGDSPVASHPSTGEPLTLSDIESSLHRGAQEGPSSTLVIRELEPTDPLPLPDISLRRRTFGGGEVAPVEGRPVNT
jgi:hypothetical protein